MLTAKAWAQHWHQQNPAITSRKSTSCLQQLDSVTKCCTIPRKQTTAFHPPMRQAAPFSYFNLLWNHRPFGSMFVSNVCLIQNRSNCSTSNHAFSQKFYTVHVLNKETHQPISILIHPRIGISFSPGYHKVGRTTHQTSSSHKWNRACSYTNVVCLMKSKKTATKLMMANSESNGMEWLIVYNDTLARKDATKWNVTTWYCRMHTFGTNLPN